MSKPKKNAKKGAAAAPEGDAQAQAQAEQTNAEVNAQAQADAGATGATAGRVPREKRNGIAQPDPNTMIGRLWTIANEVSSAQGRVAFRDEVVKRYMAEIPDANQTTAHTQYARWAKFYDLSDTIKQARAAVQDEAKTAKQAEKDEAKAKAQAEREAKAKAKADEQAAQDAAKAEAAAAAANQAQANTESAATA
jgi:hypothetical protein